MKKSMIKKAIQFVTALFVIACQTEEPIVPKQLNPQSPKSNNSQNSRIGTHPYWYFYRGESTSNLRYAYSDDAITWSGNAIFNNGAKSSTAPSTTIFNGKFMCVYKGASTNNLFYSYSYDGTNWQGNIQIPAVATIYSPSIVVLDNTLYVFFTGASYGHVYYVTSTDGTNWSSQRDVGLGNEYAYAEGPPTAAVSPYSNILYVFYSAYEAYYKGYPLKYRTLDNNYGWSGYNYLLDINVAPIQTRVSVGPSFVNGTMYVAYKSLDNDRINIFKSSAFINGSVYWSGGQSTHGPSMTYYNGKFSLVYKAQSTGNILYSNSLDGISWTGNVYAIGQTASGGPCLINNP